MGLFGKEIRKELVMKKNGVDVWGKLLLIVIVIGVFAPVAQAEDVRIEKLEAAVRALQGELASLKADRARQVRKAAPAVDQKELERLISKTFDERKGELGAVPDWVKNIKWGGDFRYRYESLDNTSNEVGNKRRRNRIRARLKMKAKVNDEWDAIFRIATGSSDSPTSTNQTLENSFESKDLWLDLAYADWHPESTPGLNVLIGKMKNPFYRVGGNQLIWDGDVNPEGGAAKYSWDLDNNTSATVVGGAFWLDARSSDADAGYFGIQAMLKHKYDDGSHLLYGASFYDIGNISSKAAGTSALGVTLEGNTGTGGATPSYRYDYDVVEGFAEYGFKCNEMPVKIFSNYVQNTAAPSGRNTAYSIGAQLNKAKKPGSWQLKASYRDVDSDAVFAGLSDSDFIDGGTGGKGWVLGYKYQVAKNIQAGLTYFINDRDRRTGTGQGVDASGGSGSQTFNRLQADLIFKF